MANVNPKPRCRNRELNDPQIIRLCTYNQPTSSLQSLRLAFTWRATSVGGAERSLAELAHELKSQGYPVRLLLFAANEDVAIAITSQIADITDVQVGVFYENVYLQTVSQACRDVDLIVSSRRTLHLDRNIADAFQRPLVAIAREIIDVSPNCQNIDELSNYKLADHIIAISTAVRDRFVELGFDPHRISIALNGICLPEATITNNTSPSSPLTFASIGRLVRWKKVECFLAAARIIYKKLGDAVAFRVIGDGKEMANLKATARQLNVPITFDGWITPIWQAKRLFDCLVLTTPSEPFGRVLVESLAMGKPVIAARSGGPLDILAAERESLLFSPCDIDDLANKMLSVCTNPALYRHLQQNAHRTAREFDIRNKAKTHMQIYSRIVNGSATKVLLSDHDDQGDSNERTIVSI